MSASSVTAYDFLKKQFARMATLSEARSLLGKDAETVMAPGSADAREAQVVAIGESIHDIIADPRLADALGEAETGARNMEPADRRNLELMRRKWVHEGGIPADLARERLQTEAAGETLHVRHYKSGDWSQVQAHYARSFAVMREIGEAKREKLGLGSAYEALVDEFSPGLSKVRINREFAALDAALRGMIPEALERAARQSPPLPLKGPFTSGRQKKLGRDAASRIGLDFDRGVIYAIKGHPSCAGGPDDTRITTRLDRDDVLTGYFAAAHEAGHAIYEQGLPRAWRYQPVGEALGMAVHESQSMIIEYQAGMSSSFIGFLAAQLRDYFNRAGDPAFEADNIRRILWQPELSLIRVDADELTYPMHVLLRHDLESRIIGGSLEVKDLPEAWNEGMRERLGIVPPNPAKGCMQDIHWPVCYIGYFPAYTFGAMGAAQFFAAAVRANPAIPEQLGQGDFSGLRDWQRTHIHSKGSLVTTRQLFVEATGEELNAAPYLNHLSRRYLGRDYQL